MGGDRPWCMSAFNSRLIGVLVAVAIGLLPSLASAQSRNLIALERRWQALDEAEKYAEALPIAEMAVQLSEAERGPTHTGTANLLNNLGTLYESLGRYSEAETMLRRKFRHPSERPRCGSPGRVSELQ